jgi:hypothetical protein
VADGERDIAKRGGPRVGLAHATDRQDLLHRPFSLYTL